MSELYSLSDLLFCSGQPSSHDPLDDSCREFDPNRTYFTDDRCEFGGICYICVVAEGRSTRHSPIERPRDWEELEL